MPIAAATEVETYKRQTLTIVWSCMKQGCYDTLHHTINLTTLQYTVAEVDCTLNFTLSG